MHSAEVARMANVSVRTLRHYHALGLLPEPPRSQNGYREYDALDVAQVLRIRRLSSLGFSLSQIKEMLDDSEKDAIEDDALALLDRELELKIEELRAQRRVIAQLRAENLDPALPVRFARALKIFYGDALFEQRSKETMRYDQAALSIAAHLYSEDDLDELERFARRAHEVGAIEPMRELESKIEGLAPDAPEDERARLVEEAVHLLEPLLDCFDPANWLEEDDAFWELFDWLADSTQNPAQIDVNQRIEDTLVSMIRAKAQILLDYDVTS